MVETVNNCFIICGTYHLILFSAFVTNYHVQYWAGYSFYIFVVLLIAFNVGKIATEQAIAGIRKRKLRMRRLARINRQKEMIAMNEIIANGRSGIMLKVKRDGNERRAFKAPKEIKAPPPAVKRT